MTREVPVSPEAVRFWRGFKCRNTSYGKFLQLLGDMFVPLTPQIQAPLGLTAYLLAVLPEEKPDFLPDEIALVFYISQKKYKQTFKTTGGRTYGRLHSLVFDFKERRSRSGFPEHLQNELLADTAYSVFTKNVDWMYGKSRVFVGIRKTDISVEKFMADGRNILLRYSQQVGEDIDGAFVLFSNDYVVFWEHSPDPCCSPVLTGVNQLLELTEQVMLEEAINVQVVQDLSAISDGIPVTAGECYNIQFERVK
jgi:hypothetical protein